MTTELKTKPTTPLFREGMDRIFGKPDYETEDQKPIALKLQDIGVEDIEQMTDTIRKSKGLNPLFSKKVCLLCGDEITENNKKLQVVIEDPILLKQKYVDRLIIKGNSAPIAYYCTKHRMQEVLNMAKIQKSTE